MAPLSPSGFCSMKDFMVFPATGLDVRAAPALATLAMQATVEAAHFEEQAEEESDFPVRAESMASLSTIGSPRKRTFSDQLIVRNTFIAAPEGRSPSLDRFYEERQVKSNPPSGALEIAVPASPRRHNAFHKRDGSFEDMCKHTRQRSICLRAMQIMSAVEEALRCDNTDASGEASSNSGFAEGRETSTTGEMTPEIQFVSATPPPYGNEASEESWPFVEEMLMDSPGLKMPMDVAFYMMPGQQTEIDPGFAESGLANLAENMEQSVEATSNSKAGLSTVQYFAHSIGPPAALSTEPMAQVSMHGLNADFQQQQQPQQQPATTLRREMLRARGAALVEATGWRSATSPTSSGTSPSFLMSEAPCSPSPMNSPAPTTPPGTFVAGSRGNWMQPAAGQQWRSQQRTDRPMPPPPPPPPPPACNDHSSPPKAAAEELLPQDESEDFPSRGSALHKSGKCKPCAFVFEGCNNGTECQFCHLCEPGERMRRKKEKMSLRREARDAIRRRTERAEKEHR